MHPVSPAVGLLTETLVRLPGMNPHPSPFRLPTSLGVHLVPRRPLLIPTRSWHDRYIIADPLFPIALRAQPSKYFYPKGARVP